MSLDGFETFIAMDRKCIIFCVMQYIWGVLTSDKECNLAQNIELQIFAPTLVTENAVGTTEILHLGILSENLGKG
jgi:hypothetical protein